MGAGPRHDLDGLGARVVHEVRAQVASWFPELSSPVRVRLVDGQARPRCFLLRVAVEDGRARRDLVVKVRHSVPSLRRLDRFPDRTVLAPERTLPDREAAQRELAGLHLVEAALQRHEGTRIGVLRPVAWLEDVGGIVLRQVDEPTLRDQLLATSRLRGPGDRRATGGADREGPWHAAGEWLRAYRSAPTDLQLAERLGSRDELPPLFADYAGFLGREDPRRRALVQRCADVAVRAAVDLPDRFALGTSHGDFVSRNVFCSAEGRITVFDPMPLWRVPVFEDLARMLVVGLRMVDVQALSQGLALSASRLAACEQALLDGCFAPSPVPWRSVRVFQLLLLLDTWSGVVAKRSQGGGALRRGARAGMRAATEASMRREARRLLDLLERADG